MSAVPRTDAAQQAAVGAAAPPAEGSLRRTMLAWLLLPLLALVPLTAALMYLLAVRPALDGLDRGLTGNAVALSRIVTVVDGRPSLPISAQTAMALRADAVDDIFFAVGDGAGGLLGGDAPLLALQPGLAADEWRFFAAMLQGRRVRVAAHGLACGPQRICPILVAESLGKRSAAERAVLGAVFIAAFVLAFSLALLALLAVSRALRPLRRAAAEVESRTIDNLQPIDDAIVPEEAAAFVRALNGLFARLRAASAAQRAFLADAAHQLRTPLATLRSDAEQALGMPHPPELRPTLKRLHGAAERGARLAQQLLALARTEGAGIEGTQQRRFDLRELAMAVADEWVPRSLAAGQDLGFELEPAWVIGNDLVLGELLGNLIHNAIQHAGAGANITVRTYVSDGQPVLEVEDDGPGIPPTEHERIWERFVRGSGAKAQGSGLGLAIVRDIARMHGAEASLHPGTGSRGLLARIRFPASREP